MSGPHKMLLLGALASAGTHRCALPDTAVLVRDFIERRHPALRASPRIARNRLGDPAARRGLLRDMPVKHLLESAPAWFRYDRATDTFEIVLPEGLPESGVLAAVEERAEALLFDHLRRADG